MLFHLRTSEERDASVQQLNVEQPSALEGSFEQGRRHVRTHKLGPALRVVHGQFERPTNEGCEDATEQVAVEVAIDARGAEQLYAAAQDEHGTSLLQEREEEKGLVERDRQVGIEISVVVEPTTLPRGMEHPLPHRFGLAAVPIQDDELCATGMFNAKGAEQIRRSVDASIVHEQQEQVR